MPILALRAKQTTTTTGTGTLTLLAAASNARSFQAAFGSSAVVVRYVISGSNFYEVGFGTFNGGSPGTLTRSTVLASSNAGALVSLPAGTADVFAWIDPAERRVIGSTATTINLTLADLGNQIIFTGGAAATVNLPAIATVPDGAVYEIRNGSAVNMTIDGNGSETIDGLTTRTVLPAQSCDLVKTSGGWSSRHLYGAAIPVSTGGVAGEWVTLSGSGGTVTLPAGGTWAYLVHGYVSGGGLNGTLASVAAGGASFGGFAGGTVGYTGFCWRIA